MNAVEKRHFLFVAMKNLKQVILLITLAIPVAIYLFLQAFGENEFGIPIYFENGLEYNLDGCQDKSDKPYLASHLAQINSEISSEDGKVALYDLGAFAGGNQNVRNNLQAFFARYGDRDGLKYIAMNTDTMDISNPISIFSQARIDRPSLLQYGRCILQVDLKFDSVSETYSGSKLVLVDKERRIRGFYDPHELKEIDRLNTELDILLSNQHE